MLHVMAGVYILCLVISALSSGLFILSMKKHFKSRAYLNLNSNLSALDFFWSDSRSEILPLTANAIERDQKEAIQSFLRIALLATFTSVIGCLFLMLYIFSATNLAQPRLEKKIFASALAQNTILSVDEIKILVLKLQAEFGLSLL